MKYTTILLTLLLPLLLTHGASGQFDAAAARARMWGSNDPDFDITTVPEKWKNESAVILCQSVHSEYKKQALAARVNYDYYSRVRIRLLDKSAVDAYTTLSFDPPGSKAFTREGFFLGIKVIKPDGTEREIDMNEAVRMQQGTGSGYQKLAIPDLEAGDIIDYFMVSRQTAFCGNSFGGARYEFDPAFVVLSQEYPVVKGKLSFLPERRCYINIRAVNGAPQPVERTIGKEIIYEIVYGDLERIKTELWTYPYRQEPTVKYQVVMAANLSLAYEQYFLGEPEKMKTTVSEQEIKRLFNIIISKEMSRKNLLADNLKKFVKRRRVSNSDDQLFADIYYFMRHNLHFRSQYFYGMSYKNSNFYDQFDVIQAYSAILRDQKIEHTIFLSVPAPLGTLEELILLDELVPGIVVEHEGRNIFLLRPDAHEAFGEVPYHLDNTPYVSAHISAAGTFKGLTYGLLPPLTPPDNFESDSIYVKIDAAQMDTVSVHINIGAEGIIKNMFGKWMLLPAEASRDEFSFYKNIENINNTELSQNMKELRLLEEKEQKYIDHRKKNLEAWLDDRYELKGSILQNFAIAQTGRFDDEKMMIFDLKTKLPGMVSTTGNYLLIDAGRLIGANIDLTPDEKNRQQDIYMPGSRYVKWKVVIDLPDGYRIKKADNLEYDVFNQTGGFRSTVMQAGSRIIIDASKWYNHGYEPLENWPEMLQFLEAANDFVQQKLVLEKE